MLTSDFHMKPRVCIGTPSHTHIKKSELPGDISSPPLPQGLVRQCCLDQGSLVEESSEGLRAHTGPPYESTLNGPQRGPGEASGASSCFSSDDVLRETSQLRCQPKILNYVSAPWAS